MTAISPLQFVHKKGLFGDHHKVDKNDLLNISEIKNLTIVQIVKYKKSKIELNDINIEGIKFPSQNSEVSSNKNIRILWNAPNTWLLISSKEEILKTVKEKFENENFGITDISHSRAVIQIKGFQAKEVLKKGCPINFNLIKKDFCAGSVFHGVAITVDCLSENPQTFNLLALRSFGESLYHHLTDASLEFGYQGV